MTVHQLTVHKGKAPGDALATPQLLFPPDTFLAAFSSQGKNGVVYTKPWVVDFILDLAGYRVDADLANFIAIEPAAGEGAFVIPMAQRLISSCRRHHRPISETAKSLRAYEIDPVSADKTRFSVKKALIALGIPHEEAIHLTDEWIYMGNYLFEAPNLPLADFVIGNPPYIRLEDMDDALMATYRALWTTMRGRADIYIAFFEAALRRLKRNGVCAFICADRWMFNQYGAPLRQLITTNFSIETIVQMHHAKPFSQEVTAYPAITVIRREKQGPVAVGSLSSWSETQKSEDVAASLQKICLSKDNAHTPSNLRASHVETWFTGADPWPCLTPARLALLRQLEAQFPLLESITTGTKVGIGVATGLDDVLITTNPELVEVERLLPLAMAADTVGGHLQWSGHYLVNPWQTEGLVELTSFPRLKAYFTQHESRLKKRHTAQQQQRHWYRTIDRVDPALLKKQKLYIPDIQNRLNPVLDQGQTYPHHNLYFVCSAQWDLEVLGGLLLSTIGQFFIECYGVRMRGGYYRFQAQFLRRIRVPKPQDLSPTQIVSLTEAFRCRDRALATHTALDIYHIAELPLEDYEL